MVFSHTLVTDASTQQARLDGRSQSTMLTKGITGRQAAEWQLTLCEPIWHVMSVPTVEAIH